MKENKYDSNFIFKIIIAFLVIFALFEIRSSSSIKENHKKAISELEYVKEELDGIRGYDFEVDDLIDSLNMAEIYMTGEWRE